ncbi:TPA: hypothetical protein IB078_002364 [Escherichia coli]|nr:hypothetical protein [Escherichia coli]
MSFTDNWSDEEFIRQMKELIGNEGDIHVTCNHSEGEQVTETHVHAESSLVDALLKHRTKGKRKNFTIV